MEVEAARRQSRNRPRGAPVSKPRNLNAEYYRELMCMDDGVIAKIKEKMPWMRNQRLFIQHDGAKPHNGNENIAQIEAHANQDGWHIEIITQPAQSPDLNILDLGFFSSIKAQVHQLKINADTIEDLLFRVQTAFTHYDRETLDAIWAELFSVYNCILQVRGGNDYALPHDGNRRSQGNNWTKVNLNIDIDAYNNCLPDDNV